MATSRAPSSSPASKSLLLRGAGLLGVILAGLVLFSGAASAVQTETFGISPAPGAAQSGGNHLEATTKPGAPVTENLLVWNRTSARLTLDLTVQPAHLGAKDVPALGGPVAPTRWIHLSHSALTLAPHASQLVPVTITVPRVLPHLPAQAAVVATPQQQSSARVSVLIRLAVLVSMDAAKNAPSRAPVGLIGWTALALVLAAALLGIGTSLRRSRPRRTSAG
jgi:hypothetical protein